MWQSPTSMLERCVVSQSGRFYGSVEGRWSSTASTSARDLLLMQPGLYACHWGSSRGEAVETHMHLIETKSSNGLFIDVCPKFGLSYVPLPKIVLGLPMVPNMNLLSSMLYA